MMSPDDFKSKLEGKKVLWPDDWQLLADIANDHFKKMKVYAVQFYYDYDKMLTEGVFLTRESAAQAIIKNHAGFKPNKHLTEFKKRGEDDYYSIEEFNLNEDEK